MIVRSFVFSSFAHVRFILLRLIVRSRACPFSCSFICLRLRLVVYLCMFTCMFKFIRTVIRSISSVCSVVGFPVCSRICLFVRPPLRESCVLLVRPCACLFVTLCTYVFLVTLFASACLAVKHCPLALLVNASCSPLDCSLVLRKLGQFLIL